MEKRKPLGWFPSEAAAIDHFVLRRYPNGVTCNHCNSPRVVLRKDSLKKYKCHACNNHFSIFKGTLFENSKISLNIWFHAMSEMIQDKAVVAAHKLKRIFRMSYKGMWAMLHKIRTAMNEGEQAGFLDLIVEMDETYVGGKPRKGKPKKGKRGRGTAKTPVVGVFDRIGKRISAKVAIPDNDGKKLTGKQLLSILREVSLANIVITDQFKAYDYFNKVGINRVFVDHSSYYVNGPLHTNNVECFWSKLKNGIRGAYYHISVKYMQNYLDEFCFRWNHRNANEAYEILLKNAINRQ